MIALQKYFIFFKRRFGFLAGLKSALKDARGIAVIEFALIFPILIMIYLGSVELTRGVAATRKVSLLTRTLADLIGQQTSPCSVSTGTATSITTPCISTEDMNNVFNAAKPILSPYPVMPNNLQMTVSMIHIKADASKTLRAYTIWSAPYDASSSARPCDPANPDNPNPSTAAYLNASLTPTPGDMKTLPANFTDKATGAVEGYLIVSDVSYSFSSSAHTGLSSFMPTQTLMRQSQYMSTRSGGLIANFDMTTSQFPKLQTCTRNPA